MWERYCRGVDVILFIVDAADEKMFPLARKELHDLVNNRSLVNIPLLVLFNKNDLPEASPPEAVAKAL